jgi:hypothetical protein
MKIGLVTDLHYRNAVPGTSAIAKRECRRAGEILDRCLALLRNAGADLIVCAGDCVDTPGDPRVGEDLAQLRERLATSGIPTIVLPGNHDPAPDLFYEIVPRPPRVTRQGDCEIVAFGDDPFDHTTETATRPEQTMAWMRDAFAATPSGVALTLAVQHYVLYPEHGGRGYRHTYANDAEIRGVLERSPRRLLAISGHCHTGHVLSTHNGVQYFTARALCERAYPYYVLEVDGGEVRVEERTVEVAQSGQSG